MPSAVSKPNNNKKHNYLFSFFGLFRFAKTRQRPFHLLLVLEDKAEANVSLAHALNGSIALVQRDDLCPRTHVRLCRNVKHLCDLPARSNAASGKVDVVGDKVKGIERDVLLGNSDDDKGATGADEPHKLSPLDAVVEGRADNHVKISAVLLNVVLVLAHKVTLCAELLCILHLGLRARNGSHFRTKLVGKLHGKMAEAANANDADTLSRAGAVTLERCKHGDTGAHQRGNDLGRNVLGKLEGIIRLKANVILVSSTGGLAVRVRAVVRVENLGAAVVKATGAVGARGLQTGTALRADANTIANLHMLDILASLGHMSDDFVSRNERVDGRAPAAVNSVNIASADAAVGNMDLDVVVTELARVV
eukprot:Opistho-2@51543